MNEINKQIGLRIAEARKKLGLSAVELSKLTGFSSGRISHWEKGVRLPNLDSILILEKHLKVSAAYLLCIESSQTDSNSDDLSVIPLYNIHTVLEKKIANLKIPAQPNDASLFSVELIDNSMSPIFNRGDIVVFDKNRSPIDGDYILLELNTTKQVMFRKLSICYPKIDSPQIQLIPNNQDFHIINSDDMNQFSVLGVYRNKFKLFI